MPAQIRLRVGLQLLVGPSVAHYLPSNVLSLPLSLFEQAIQVLLYLPTPIALHEGDLCSSTRQLASSSVIKSRSGLAARCFNAKVMP